MQSFSVRYKEKLHLRERFGRTFLLCTLLVHDPPGLGAGAVIAEADKLGGKDKKRMNRISGNRETQINVVVRFTHTYLFS